MVGRTVPAAPDADAAKRRAVRFVVLLGVVSLFADMTYEGARGEGSDSGGECGDGIAPP